jgi:hypothetical protein
MFKSRNKSRVSSDTADRQINAPLNSFWWQLRLGKKKSPIVKAATLVPEVSQAAEIPVSAEISVFKEVPLASDVLLVANAETGAETSVVAGEGSAKQAPVAIKAEIVSLWDKGYESLNEKSPSLIADYEDLLSRVLIEGQFL